jgi:hypothetical protein
MGFVADVNEVKWLVGPQVDDARRVMREVDSYFLVRILDHLFAQGGAMHGIGKRAQKICDQARAVIAQQPIAQPLRAGANQPYDVFDIYNIAPPQQGEDPYAPAKAQIRRLATINIYSGDTLLSPLAIGDFSSAFADMLGALPGQNANPAPNAHLIELKTLLGSLQDPVAFNRLTNRSRVFRRNIFEQGPDVGLVNWYLPPEDVLGAMDRMLGYYETADISGSTTDALGALAMLSTTVENPHFMQIGTADQIRHSIVEMINNGRAFASFATIVAQQHHSLPESMMAINLIPPVALHQQANQNAIDRFYSPYLTNSDFAAFAAIYTDWKAARASTLKISNIAPNVAYTLFVLQDVYQMPNKPELRHEVGLIVGLSLVGTARADNDLNPNIFGRNAYNAFVGGLNTPGPGPAPSLQRLSARILPGAAAAAPLINGAFNPLLAGRAADVRTAVTKGMMLPPGVLQNAANYIELIEPFVGSPIYGVVQTVAAA